MERAGIDDGVARKKDGKLGRNVSRLSFHSLRHSFNSAMANADVPLEIRQKLTGHASQDMNKHYTHLELGSLRGCGGRSSPFLGCRTKLPTHLNEKRVATSYVILREKATHQQA
jgi:hypothetical protein